MIVDSSALVAILFNEPEAAEFARLMMRGPCRISAANYFEAGMVVDRRTRDEIPRQAFDTRVATTRLEIVAVTREQADEARMAYRRFGKGNHEARLNFGDCFAYVLAKGSGEPLLFKGDDFGLTDVTPAS